MNTPIFSVHNPTTLYDPSTYAYSHIAEVKKFSRIIHITGQGGENVHGVLSEDFQTQLNQAFLNIESALAHVHTNIDDIAVLRILLVDHNSEKHQLLIQEMHRIWNGKNFPACTLIPVPCLALSNMLIEIEATAYCA